MNKLDIDFKLNVFKLSVLFIHVAYLGIFFGVVLLNDTYLRNLSTVIQFGICVFLIVRFFPFRKKHELNKLDTYIIFYCATFLLLNVVVIEMYSKIFIPFEKTITQIGL